MFFGYLEASTSELRVSEISATASEGVGWVSFTPYLINQNHVSKHTQVHNVVTQRDFATP